MITIGAIFCIGCYNIGMTDSFDVTPYLELLRESKRAFLEDSAYAIAIAKPAGSFAARAREKEESEESANSDV